jgi:hypothetical protein
MRIVSHEIRLRRIYLLMTTTKSARRESSEYLALNKSIHIYKPDTHPIDKMVRLYCTQWATSWKLQVRGPLSVGCNGTKEGKSSVIANAELSLEQMISLRDALNEFINEAQRAITQVEAA